MDIMPVITTILGSGSFFALIQYFLSRHDKKTDEYDSIRKELQDLKAGQIETNLKVSRMELANLIRNDTKNVDAVLQVAEYYFITLKGNAYAHAMFEKWAQEQGVPIGWLPKITKGVKNGKKK